MKASRILKSFPIVPIAFIAFTVWVLFTPATSNWVMEGEATANGYGVLVREYPSASPAAKTQINQRLEKGYLTRRDVSDLIGEILDGAPVGYGVSTLAPLGMDEPKESFNTEILRRLTGDRLEARSKTLLLQLAHDS
ncbi:hypothetical protein PZT57_30720 [Pseudomonas aeruginosa]|uniref:hypothetical protein n=1 Tax=Pseudomonas aeruginosa TaxID=287 RepID=UPI002B266D98|nr:hypothetical protein [Pseudomonas aeruginosa]MEA8593023.1 hypothetical protein [Pseudomonas aeruginosa]